MTTRNAVFANVRVRFAPSPNGLLHVGHAKSALLNAHFARDHHGQFLLRLEDIDITRARAEFETAIINDLSWLGLKWSEPLRRQSEHFESYKAALTELRKLGLLYPAFLSRAEIAHIIEHTGNAQKTWPRDPDGAPHYPDRDRHISDTQRARRIENGEPHAWRLDMTTALKGISSRLSWHEFGSGPKGETGRIPADPAQWGDVILARRDIPASYHLAVTLDDAVQNITDIIRGQDLFAATSVHRLLQTLLNLPEPRYHHHALVLGEDGRKLSKSQGSTALANLRNQGATPADIARMAGVNQLLRF